MRMRTLLSLVALALGFALHAQDTGPAYNTSRGFVHPGGLHTQADFDRVRQQLADGHAKVTAAYAVLKSAAYAQPGVTSSPVETIVRGGGVGENYMNAARATAMAYQNALRWKIEDNKSCAQTAVAILMAWARVTKHIGGDSNYALAAGLYGYQFAQAAELVRDYEGWSAADFEEFKRWMLEVWYPSSIGFLRGRNGTWANTSMWWQAPGAYWSNWGLCNALCVISIGVLCDDVYIYNQGMSYFKYDQVGTYANPQTLHEVTGHEGYNGTLCIHNDGLTEFLGNLVVTQVESPLETGAYGQLGQLNESGRDAGHSSMSLGLACDLAKVGWNQGDDLFAYMDHRLAAGTEYLAAQTQSVEDLPWTNYMYGDAGLYYTDSRAWLMTGPALGAQSRPYWGTVIGIYEGVKGVSMPYSELAYADMGIDYGGQGATSGGYDHLGYSVLMNTRDVQLCPADQVPTELRGHIAYGGTINSNLIPSLTVERTLGNIDGDIIRHNELGGVVNNYNINVNNAVPKGVTITLMPQLPDGEEDTGLWQWNTGQTTRDITLVTDSSHVYRVTYTNARGIQSSQCFPVAIKGDCIPTALTPNVTYNSTTTQTDTIDVLYGKTVTLEATPTCGWGTYKWSTGASTQSITTSAIHEDQTVSVTYTNQGGATTTQDFHIHVLHAIPYHIIDGQTTEAPVAVVVRGGSITLGLTTPTTVTNSKVSWSDGTTGTKKLVLDNLQESAELTATFTLAGEEYAYTFQVYVMDDAPVAIPAGNYLVMDAASGRLLTGHGRNQLVSFDEGDTASPAEGQVWYISQPEGEGHSLQNLPDSLSLSLRCKLSTLSISSFYFYKALGTERYALYSESVASGIKYWTVDADGTPLTEETEPTTFPFVLVRVGGEDAIRPVVADGPDSTVCYDLSGCRIQGTPRRGICIVGGKKHLIR